MNLEEAIEENNEYETAKKWLTENGVFKHSEKNTKDSKSLNSKVVKVIHKITFQKNEDSEVKTSEGEDLKKLIIDMYKSES